MPDSEDNFVHDDGSTDVGARDLKFGTTGLLLAAGIAILLAIIS